MKKELGIYIHIPFCKNKCKYCDFISFKGIEKKQDEYIECVLKEIDTQNWKEINEKYEITTIYIGGGTPSYLCAENISKILNLLKYKIKRLNKWKEIEITIEINPGTVDEQKLIEYKNCGVNRLSIGLQTTSNKLLKQLGRIHNLEQFLETYKLAKKAGFKNINIDLMLGLPNQTVQDLKESIEQVVELNPNHISVYSLILEEGTEMFKDVEDKKLKLPSEEIERQMYWYVKNKLELLGYKHYEISNFSKEGKESKHNLNCWNQEEYLGFGIAAHSYFENKRYCNTSILEDYIKNIKDGKIDNNIEVLEIQDFEARKKEYMMLGLRKIDGVSIKSFKEKFIENPIYTFRKELDELSQNELIEIDGDSIKLTNKGLDYANLVWEQFI